MEAKWHHVDALMYSYFQTEARVVDTFCSGRLRLKSSSLHVFLHGN